MKELKEKLASGDMFLIITGGPGYGKSRFASEIGFALSNRQENEDKFNYVIWINMRDISNPPQLEDVAGIILREFRINTTEMKERNIDILLRKFESITASGKRALLIFDNADDLISPQNSEADESCTSSTYMELSRHIGTHSRESSIRAILTTRVYNILDRNVDDHLLTLSHLSDEESRCYLERELKEMADLDRDQIITELVNASCGHPFVLALICSNVNAMQCGKMIEDYVNKFSKYPLETVGKRDNKLGKIHLYACFKFSLDRLQEDDIEFISLLAVFPSRFSYNYVTKLLSLVGKSDTLDPIELLKRLENHSLIEDQSSNSTGYIIHLFLCQYIRKEYWKGSTSNEASFTKLYTNELFVLGKESFKRDNYFDCWKEFEVEQHNFLYVMSQIGKSCDQDDCPSHIKEAIINVLTWSTSDFIAMCLFCIDLTKPSLLLKFVEVCERFASNEQKKNIWCCRYDLSMKCFDNGIEDPYKELELDPYGKALLDKRLISNDIQSLSQKRLSTEGFARIDDELKEFKSRVDILECMALKNYFNFHILKLKGRLFKKGLNIKELNIEMGDCIKVYNDALDICNEHFGKSWITVDCHNQLGKLFRQLGDFESAVVEFDKAIELAKSMSLRNTRRFGSCLLDKGRCLIDWGIDEKVKEGRDLLENVVQLSKDVPDTRFWCRAIGFLLSVDRSKVDLVKERFFQTDKPNRSIITMMEDALKLDIDSSEEDIKENNFLEQETAKAKNLKNAIAKLEKIQNFKISTYVYDESTSLDNAIKKHLFMWRVWAASRYNHVLLLSERKEYAKSALEIMNACPYIHRGKERELQAVLGQDFDGMEAEEMLQQGYYIERIGKKLVKEGRGDELMERYSKLLVKCEANQKLWSLVVSQTSRNVPFMLEKVTKLLCAQSEPCDDLLELVHSKFKYEIAISKREASADIILEKSRKAVDNLKKAIQYIDKLLKENDADAHVFVGKLGANRSCWCKCIALDADHCLMNDERRAFAEAALCSAYGLGKDETEKLNKIIFREGTKDEQEKRMKKSLLCKVTKFMRENGKQDDLEKRYEGFINDCSAFPRVRFEMVKFILMNKNVEIPKFAKYLRYLLRHFQDGSLNSWDYQFIINIANEFLSHEMEISSRMENVEIYQLIFDSLHHSDLATGLKNKLEFEFLAIFALKVGNDTRDLSIRKQDAQQALEVFPNIGGKYKRKDKTLFQLKCELEKLLESRESEL